MREASRFIRSLAGPVLRTMLLTCLISLMLVRNASAYLDPGAGSMLMQAALASMAALFVTLRMYPARIKAFLVRAFARFRRKTKEPESSSMSE
jgi:hypothetical protein